MKPTLDLDLSGPDGNIFVIVGKARKLLNKEDGDEMWQRVQTTHSYDDALTVIRFYIEISDLN